VRPTSDRVKESVFNILSGLEGRSFLDLYAGSGSMGLEALSRGASRVVFVEKSRSCIEAIRRNLVLIRTGLSSEVIGATVEQGIRILGRRRESFDIVFADPPYGKGYVKKTLDLLGRSALLAHPSGVLVLQHSAREEPTGKPAAFGRTRKNRYGETEVSFYQWRG
jgi:16S rRNA (guanine(966)-N(2))-methyltransferase RsmD